MPDLNSMLEDVQKKEKILKKDMEQLLKVYEKLHHDAHIEFITERNKTGSMEGLEDFYYLVNTIRRNRDVIGSLLRGVNNFRPLSKYKFIEEDTLKS